MLAGALAALVCGGPAAASPASAAPATYTYRIDSAWNRHRRGGADNRRVDALVVLVRAADDTVRVSESGTARDFSMSMGEGGNTHRVEQRRWLRRWVGAWRGDALTLRRADEQCAAEVRWNREGPIPEACRATPEALVLRCAPWSGDPADGLKGAAGWRCAPSEGPGHDTLPWIFADRCVTSARDPSGRVHLRACPPDPGPPTP